MLDPPTNERTAKGFSIVHPYVQPVNRFVSVVHVFRHAEHGIDASLVGLCLLVGSERFTFLLSSVADYAVSY